MLKVAWVAHCILSVIYSLSDLISHLQSLQIRKDGFSTSWLPYIIFVSSFTMIFETFFFLTRLIATKSARTWIMVEICWSVLMYFMWLGEYPEGRGSANDKTTNARAGCGKTRRGRVLEGEDAVWPGCWVDKYIEIWNTERPLVWFYSQPPLLLSLTRSLHAMTRVFDVGFWLSLLLQRLIADMRCLQHPGATKFEKSPLPPGSDGFNGGSSLVCCSTLGLRRAMLVTKE
jgi:hypothetical protein